MTRPVVIVNPTSSGSELAPAFAHRNVPAIAISWTSAGTPTNSGFATKSDLLGPKGPSFGY